MKDATHSRRRPTKAGTIIEYCRVLSEDDEHVSFRMDPPWDKLKIASPVDFHEQWEPVASTVSTSADFTALVLPLMKAAVRFTAAVKRENMAAVQGHLLAMVAAVKAMEDAWGDKQ